MMMMSILFFLILLDNRVCSSSFIVLRHIRLSTDNEQYHLRCPYNFNSLTLQLLNYSNNHCFNLYLTANNNNCRNHQSPCQFHAKPVQLYCQYYSYSNYVDITYQCSYKSTISPFTLHQFSFPTNSSNSDETVALFLIVLGIVTILWIFICCICYIRCYNYNKTNQLLSYRSDPSILHINPFETNHISSLRTTQFV